MTTLNKNASRVQAMTIEQLKKVVSSGSLLAAAARFELLRRKEEKK